MPRSQIHNLATTRLLASDSSFSVQSNASSSRSSVADGNDDDENSASDAGFQFADDNERRSSLRIKERSLLKVPASMVETEEADEDEEVENDDDGALPPKKRGRPRKTSSASSGKSTPTKKTPTKSTSAKSTPAKATPAKSTPAKATRGGRGGKNNAARRSQEKIHRASVDFQWFFQDATQEESLDSNCSQRSAAPDGAMFSALKPPQITF